jgi:hypothetical protein
MGITEGIGPRGTRAAGQQSEESLGNKHNNGTKNESSERGCHDEQPSISAPRPVRTSLPLALSSSATYYEETQLTQPASVDNLVEVEGDEKPVCMFVADCNTGSQLRKAISHLFGRNKTCTLKIPKMVWVYYCRKHYQRVRYRNARTYPVTQMELVETQIERLHTWSEQNKAKGKGAYINSWTLSLRKREEKRRQEMQEVHEGDDTPKVGADHVPSWILSEVDKEHSTDSMFAIAARLREELADGSLSQVPEIEFLPDIVHFDKDEEPVKPTRQRRHASAINGMTKTLKRKESDFLDMIQPGPDPSYAGHGHGCGPDGLEGPLGKRPRISRAASFPHHQSSERLGAQMVGSPHPYAIPPYVNGSHGPPGGRNMMPKVQTMESHRSSPHSASNGHHQQVLPGQSHHRVPSYHDAPEPEYTHEPLYQHHAMPYYRQTPAHLSEHQGSPAAPPTLPSIASQMKDNTFLYGRNDRALPGPRYHLRESLRPMHQRSTSMQTPEGQYIHLRNRPSSSGSAEPLEYTRYEAGSWAPPTSAYDARQHGPQLVPQSHVEGDAYHHRYDGTPGWASPHVRPAPGPGVHNHAAYPYAHESAYGGPCEGMKTSNGAAARSTLSVYPEPIINRS